jgi:microcystin-dependent protein
MSAPYVGEIRMFAGNFAPLGWELCHGQLLSISENDVLFNLIGTTYGGDGQETFALPDLRGRVPIHQSSNNQLASAFGTESVTLTVQQIPSHNHVFLSNGSSSSTPNPIGAFPGRNASADQYTTDGSVGFVTMAPNMVSSVGGSQPHDNMMPFLCINFIISLFGIYPTPN